ncbi:hypothetical protein P5673_007872 [Acropora cervicornis]|uniref:Uncharacterized protein n=1 Tax=Acropora cervicornis TaxID=6130 RepID=A0AAD9QV72_ACRCE|nr:hypothetical protein P5673_007872 [Acropora cervicornis]
MLHARSRLINEVSLMAASQTKDFVSRMLITNRGLRNLKEANDCKIAGAAKKLSGLPEHVMEYIMGECGPDSCKVLRIVKQCQVGEIHFFIWNKTLGNTFAAYKEIEHDLSKPFFFDDAGCHVLRMKSQRAEVQLANAVEIREKVCFLKGDFDNHCIVRLPNFHGLCG